MRSIFHWLSKNKFQAYLLAFALVILPPIGLFYTSQSTTWTMILLIPIVLGNLLAILIR